MWSVFPFMYSKKCFLCQLNNPIDIKVNFQESKKETDMLKQDTFSSKLPSV